MLLAVFVSGVYSIGAQQEKKIPRIGLLVTGSASSASSHIDAFRRGLYDLGYAEGKNIAIEYRYAAGKSDRLPEQAAELVRLKVDVLVAQGAPAAHAQGCDKHDPQLLFYYE